MIYGRWLPQCCSVVAFMTVRPQARLTPRPAAGTPSLVSTRAMAATSSTSGFEIRTRGELKWRRYEQLTAWWGKNWKVLLKSTSEVRVTHTTTCSLKSFTCISFGLYLMFGSYERDATFTSWLSDVKVCLQPVIVFFFRKLLHVQLWNWAL